MDMSSVLSFITDNKWIILFYLIIILVIYVNRKKFQFEAKFIAMFRAKWGIPLMDRIGKKHSEFIKLLGYIGIGVGFIGMLIILCFMVKGVYDAILIPSAPATFSLVIPGVRIPGNPVSVPFWYGIIALFIVVAIHEFCHGVVARAHNLKVQNTGIVFFGPIIGAFVEPDEKELVKRDDLTQLSLFAAGPFSNVILAVLVYLLISLVFAPIELSMVQFDGVRFSEIQKGFPAEVAGVQPGVTYSIVNGQHITGVQDFANAINCVKPGEGVTLATANESHLVITTESPTIKGQGYLGVVGIESSYDLKSHDWWYVDIFQVLQIFSNPFAQDWHDYALLQWVVLLSLGIGLANLLPLGPVDGGRMIQLAFVRVKGKEKGNKAWMQLTVVVLVVLILLIVYPILKATVFKSFF